MTGILLKTNGEYEVIEYQNTLEELHSIVNGFIEYVHIFPNIEMIVNEEGLLIGLEFNELATRFYNHGIVGNALIVSTKNGENVSLTSEQVEFIIDKLK